MTLSPEGASELCSRKGRRCFKASRAQPAMDWKHGNREVEGIQLIGDFLRIRKGTVSSRLELLEDVMANPALL